MLSEEEMAINRLECGNTAHSRNADYIQLAIKALKKQVPENVQFDIQRLDDGDEIEIEYCNICGSNVYCDDKYCSNCGQKLDWGDSN